MNKEIIDSKDQHNKTCRKCKENFIYFPGECFWDDKGLGYSTKLVKCPYCGCINVLKHNEDRGLDVNNDLRFYE